MANVAKYITKGVSKASDDVLMKELQERGYKISGTGSRNGEAIGWSVKGIRDFGQQHQNMASVLNAGFSAYDNKSIKKGIQDVFFDGGDMNFENFRWDRAAVGIPTAIAAGSAVSGAVRGATTDGNGNFDIAGIPFI